MAITANVAAVTKIIIAIFAIIFAIRADSDIFFVAILTYSDFAIAAILALVTILAYFRAFAAFFVACHANFRVRRAGVAAFAKDCAITARVFASRADIRTSITRITITAPRVRAIDACAAACARVR